MFTFTTIGSYHSWLAGNPDGCQTAVRHYLEEIGKQERLNAFLEVYQEEALAKARELDEKRKAGRPTGRLHGVVVALKDVIAHQGHRMTAASKILNGFTSIYNATVVERLLAEEAIIIGRNNCDEFAMGSTSENSAYGNVLNGRCPGRVPGGSSGGSAVAVQAGLAMVSLGSDTGGSVRQPADFCGVVGFKPTYGRVSRYGLIAYASSFDQIGIFGQTVPDVARVLEVIAGPDEFDSTAVRAKIPQFLPTDRTYRIAYFKEALSHKGLDPEIRDAILGQLDDWRQAGHTVAAVDFELFDYIVPAYYVLTTAEASSNLARFDGVRYGYRSPEKGLELTEFYKRTRSESFGREVKRRILLGTFVLSAGYYDAYFTKAQQVRKLLVDHTNLLFNDFDILILPTSPSTAFKLGEKMSDPIAMYLADIYTVYANLTGIPGISLPLFTHTNGMAFGIQAMTSRFKELTLLQFSHQMMQQ
ncbi:MAG TPA: Asp-tRNA(Asn)/Glu-tRNA(Gln) amidotransferase subunit GatA [Puia sp.]|jgi:aspartyl-tRNA(Asn)/glutamyl-tRNA(Gln) amidotransferase subunit A|nr:Asp-tRNA(Asn)/Glu-tRNA(Gln) amidotransferase subunit GatA [Puia sp.]